jgi:hypothetical protein
MAIESEQSRTIEASVSADLAVHAMIEGTTPPYVEIIQHGGALPTLAKVKINFYCGDATKSPVIRDLAALVRQSFGVKQVHAVA